MQVELSKGRIAWACATAIAASAWMLPNLKAQFGGGADGQIHVEDGGVVPTIFNYEAKFSPEVAATRLKLWRKAPMKFATGTSLEDFIKHIKKVTADKDDPEGLMIYIDPIGLQEAEKTLTSPITLDLANIKIETALKLALRQIDLTFYVTADGLVTINSTGCRDSVLDADTIILDTLAELKAEVRQLRGMIGSKK